MEDAENRPKRQKRESSYKAKAFEKFKQLKSGKRNKYEEEEVDNVYETVDDKEYVKKVLARQDDDWIVDDDGSGYVEDGRDIFDDDLDMESIAAATSSKNKGTKRKKKTLSESAGKGNLQYMISNMPAKKKEETKIDNDQILSELLGEIDEASDITVKPKPLTPRISTLSAAKKAESDYLQSFATPKKLMSSMMIPKATNRQSTITKDIPDTILKDTKNIIAYNNEKDESEETTQVKNAPSTQDCDEQKPENIENKPQEDILVQDQFDDDLDMSQIDDFEMQMDKDNVTNTVEDQNFMANWESQDTDGLEVTSEQPEVAPTELNDKNVFRFFWWDSYENVAIQPGVVFLFGKTYQEGSKSYVSCCVAVRDIERKLYFLPRQFNEVTDAEITTKDVYTEINETLMKSRQVKTFKARPISKKYAFDPEIPRESDYIELRYSAKYAGINATTTGKTFSKVFGTESSYLEILLLERKIKGPCWLDISNWTPVSNPSTWCKVEIECHKTGDVNLSQSDNPLPPPPLVVSAINMRRAVSPKTHTNEIVMLSCVTNVSYAVDKQNPGVPFQKHFCVFTSPQHQVLPLDLHSTLSKYKATTVQKMDSEKALLNYFINTFAKLDTDLIVGHDLQGYQMSVLSERLLHHRNTNFGKMGRLKRTNIDKQKLERELFIGRLVCDIKTSAKELIRCRSYDLDALCQTVLKLKDGDRIELKLEDIMEMFHTSQDIVKLISVTMQDTAYILKIMYNLNIIPLALQITNIAGNVMSRTLLGGRSERNEFLLLHAFQEKDYIVPDKQYKKRRGEGNEGAKKKASYSGGLVLDPKVGFYDKLILLMDFNSLYPSIIQEYNICFTTMPPNLTEDNIVLPDRNLPAGILPTEIRKLVESRRAVKALMNSSDVTADLKLQYHIRQMALKLTANSMYGCLGFSNSRFYAKNLAALITHKGREILTNTKEMVEKMTYEVIYGDTDSIMINTNIVDHNQVSKIGNKIKQEINRLYRSVELDIDGVFKYLLLLKKKKYAAVVLSKTKTGELRTEVEYKGLDIVRRDWSRLASEAGKFVLNQILSDQSQDDRVTNICTHLAKLKEDLEQGQVPLSLLVIVKQLTKNPSQYQEKHSQPHVEVALRYNKDRGGHLRSGDTVPYVICDDGTDKSATHRAYHIEELKNSETLKIDVQYYLAQQIHPVVSRICEPIEGMDSYQIAECLGVDSKYIKRPRVQGDTIAENVIKPEIKFRDTDKFYFDCLACKTKNSVEGVLKGRVPFLEKCDNAECTVRPVEYLGYIQNQLIVSMRLYISKYYDYEMMCEDPMCTNETNVMPLKFSGRFPVCTLCDNAVMLKKYTERNLYYQLSYFQHIFDLSKLKTKPLLEYQVEKGYQELKRTVERRLKHCAYSVINMSELFSGLLSTKSRIELEIDEENEDEDLD